MRFERQLIESSICTVLWIYVVPGKYPVLKEL